MAGNIGSQLELYLAVNMAGVVWECIVGVLLSFEGIRIVVASLDPPALTWSPSTDLLSFVVANFVVARFSRQLFMAT